MPELGYATLPIIPSLRGASGIISRELSAQSKTAGVAAGRQLGTTMTRTAAESTKKSSLFTNIEKGAAVSGTNVGKRFGLALHESLGEYVKQIGAMAAGFFAFEKAKDILHGMIEEADEARKVTSLTNQVLQSTGGVAGVSAKHVSDLAGAISQKVGVDDEAIQSGENLLLTFKNIRNEAGAGNKIFDQATQSFVDLAAGMAAASGGAVDYRSAVTLVGKALNDPIKGLTALQRVGVTFTDQQKDQIKALVESGNVMGAQKLILRELKSEFGGAAEALATPAEKATVAWKNFEEEVGTKLLPLVEHGATAGAASLEGISKAAGAIPGPLKEAGLAWLVFSAAQKTGLSSAILSRLAAARAQTLGTASSLRVMAADAGIAAKSMLVAGAASEREAAAMARTRGALFGLGKGAAVLGGVALLATGASDKLGLTNTASLALAGSMTGPLGAAVGGTIGAFLDLRSATSGISSAINESDGSVEELTKKLHDLQAQSNSLSQQEGSGNFLTKLGGGLKDVFGGNWASKASFIPVVGSYISALGGAQTATDRLDQATGKTRSELDKLTGTAFENAAAQGAYGKSAQVAAQQTQAEAKALEASRKAARQNADSFIAFDKSLNDSKVSLGQWITQMAKQATALRDFTRNAQTAADRGLRQGLIAALEKAGPEGALRMQQLATATDAQIKRANRSWAAGQRAVRGYVDVVGGVPTSKSTDLRVRDLASGAVRRLKNQLDGLHDKKVTVTIALANAAHALAVEQQLLELQHRAGGGSIDPRDLYLVGENGPELFVSDRAGQIIPNSALRAGGPHGHGGGVVAGGLGNSLAQAITKLQKYLDGHDKLNKRVQAALTKQLDRLKARQSAIGSFSLSSVLPTKDPTNPIWAGTKAALDQFQRDFTKAGGKWTGRLQDESHSLLATTLQIDKLNHRLSDPGGLNDQLETAKSNYSSLNDTMQQFGEQAASNFRTALFGATDQSGNPVAQTGSGILSILQGDQSQAQSFLDAFTKLAGEGLSTSILSELASKGDVASATSLANTLTSSDIASINAGVTALDSVLSQVASATGSAVYGQQVADALAMQNKIQAQVDANNKQIDALVKTANALVAAIKTTAGQEKVVDAVGKVEQAIKNLPAEEHRLSRK